MLGVYHVDFLQLTWCEYVSFMEGTQIQMKEASINAFSLDI